MRAEEERFMEGLMARVKKGEVVSNVEVKRQTKEGKRDHYEHDDLTAEGCRGKDHRRLTDL